MTTENKLQWWGYLHTSGTIQAKRYFSQEDIAEALSSPFLASGREEALTIITERLKPK